VSSGHRIDGGAGAILTLLRSGEQWTRSEIVRSTGFARATVSQRLEALMALGYVIQSEGVSSGGRPPETFVFNKAGGVVLAADIGGSHTRVGVTDLVGGVLAEAERDIDVAEGPEAVLGWVHEEFDRLLSQLGPEQSRVWGVGVGLPGPVDSDSGRLVSPPTMPGWDGFDVPGFFRARYGLTPVVDRDANILALGEHRSAWLEHQNIVVLKVGMGLGCGIIANGQLVRGAQGAAGDIAHLPRGEDRPCRCGNRGCTEATAGGWAIAQELETLGHDVRTSEDIVRLSRAGNFDAVRLVRQAGRVIGEVVADVVGLLNPSVVVVGGNLSVCREPLLAGIREVVYSRSQPLSTRDLEITHARLTVQAGIVGASQMVRDRLFDPDSVNATLDAKAVLRT
jgi:predicted NBD/HSP70 family sugar kinase